MDNINVDVRLIKQIGSVKVVMLKGEAGSSIESIEKTSTELNVDTYTITLTDGSHTTFQVTNGSSIATIEKTASIGHTDIYTITLTDGSTSTFEVTNGDNWIDNDENLIRTRSGKEFSLTRASWLKVRFENANYVSEN